jgi:hypothetical protein
LIAPRCDGVRNEIRLFLGELFAADPFESALFDRIKALLRICLLDCVKHCFRFLLSCDGACLIEERDPVGLGGIRCLSGLLTPIEPFEDFLPGFLVRL